MATHSTNLGWKIPWTEEPCGLQSVGPTVGHYKVIEDTEHRDPRSGVCVCVRACACVCIHVHVHA